MKTLSTVEQLTVKDNKFSRCDIITLKTSDKKKFDDISQSLISNGDEQNYQHLISSISQVIPEIKSNLPELVQHVQYLSSPATMVGLLLLKNLPEGSSSIHAPIISSILGFLVKYEGEGDFIIPIKENSNSRETRPSFQNNKEFSLHSDLTYAPEPPKHIVMHYQATNHGGGGHSIFCDVLAALDDLNSDVLSELQKNQFLFTAPSHYKGNSVVKFPILTKDVMSNSWSIRFRKDGLKSETAIGAESVAEFVNAINRNSFEIIPEENSIVLLNNRTFLHGRTAYLSMSKLAKPRHLNRIYINS
jgi:hypothetical protein